MARNWRRQTVCWEHLIQEHPWCVQGTVAAVDRMIILNLWIQLVLTSLFLEAIDTPPCLALSIFSMSSVPDEVCANCGIVACDDGGGGGGGGGVVKLKNCTACLLVKYCSVDCQKTHRKQHKKPCMKRAAELRDERLYSQGRERPEEDFCLICTLPIPSPMHGHSLIGACCMKRVCNGCDLAAQRRGMFDCAFCRTPKPYGENDAAQALGLVQARVEKNDPAAICFLGDKYLNSQLGLRKDVSRAVELYTEASALGSMKAHYNLGCLFIYGNGVPKNVPKGVKHWEEGAMLGHVSNKVFYCRCP